MAFISILENSSLLIEVNEHGAELNKLFSKKHNLDFLWSGDSTYWGRKSPILFPIVGRLKDNETLIDDKIFNMNQHGFARDCTFKLINENKNSIRYSLIANEDTRKRFPYNFELLITYELHDNSIKVLWNVKNIDSKIIYFSIGAHPAFNVPFKSDEKLEDYYLAFKTKEDVEKYTFELPYIKGKSKVKAPEYISIKPEVFKNDALIYNGVDEVTLKSTNNDMALNVTFKDFPFVGIWSPYYTETNTMAPFVCIEPWYGIADLKDSTNVFKNKLGVNKIEVGEEFNASYEITIT
ncbi:aldose 1-epimerase family protein [Clostridium algoriphilum]|uniref:aldose 1-epimerase family protein n=1 Tax=Clostridium algoriphilum TaxID=198347 RepID=UPI001CF59BE4|nr:aldose 1-epimerase family protein [Clostridium algoriphilum]MCB2293693.1 aldose 1-epimerase family protein [Clostridium algoriphilum]